MKVHLELAHPRRSRTRDVPFLITGLNKILLCEGDESVQSGELSRASFGAGSQRQNMLKPIRLY